MKAPTQQALWDVVVGNREGVLATIGRTGVPHLSNVYYVADPASRVIRVSTTAGRAKGRNLLRDPRAALHVPGRDFFNFTVAEGDVTLAAAATPGDAATDELYEVHSALNGAVERPAFDRRMIDDRRMVVRIEVTRLYGLVHDGR